MVRRYKAGNRKELAAESSRSRFSKGAGRVLHPAVEEFRLKKEDFGITAIYPSDIPKIMYVNILYKSPTVCEVFQIIS